LVSRQPTPKDVPALNRIPAPTTKLVAAAATISHSARNARYLESLRGRAMHTETRDMPTTEPTPKISGREASFFQSRVN